MEMCIRIYSHVPKNKTGAAHLAFIKPSHGEDDLMLKMKSPSLAPFSLPL